jgi:hypothetical protein
VDGSIRSVSRVVRDGCCLWMTSWFGINLRRGLDTRVNSCVGGNESPVLIPSKPNRISMVRYPHLFKFPSFPFDFLSASTICPNPPLPSPLPMPGLTHPSSRPPLVTYRHPRVLPTARFSTAFHMQCRRAISSIAGAGWCLSHFSY